MSAAAAEGAVEAAAVVDIGMVRARRAFSDLEAWAVSEESRELPEHEVEREIDRQGREVMRLLLQAHVHSRGTGEVGPAILVRTSGGPAREQAATRVDPRTLASVFGKVRVVRTAYTAAGAEAVHPLDGAMRLPARSYSYEVQRRVVEEAVRGPFCEAVESLERNTGTRVPKRSAQAVVVEAARDFDAFYAGRARSDPARTGPILVGSVDGKGVPMVKPEGARRRARRKKGEKDDKKKMATVATVYTAVPRVRTPEEVVASLFEGRKPEGTARARPEHKRVWASLEKSKDEVIGEMAAEMAARDGVVGKRRVVVTDGERALQQRVRKSLPGALLILDFFHVLERLWLAGQSLCGEGTEAATAWVREHALRVLRGQAGQVVKGMRQSVTKRGLGGRREGKAILAAAEYLHRNLPRMAYGEYLAMGLPIASGAVEGACKNLVKDRFERSGMRWTIPGAEAVLKLRAVKLSGDMDEYWRFHIEQDQRRLYDGVAWKPINEK